MGVILFHRGSHRSPVHVTKVQGSFIKTISAFIYSFYTSNWENRFFFLFCYFAYIYHVFFFWISVIEIQNYTLFPDFLELVFRIGPARA